MFSQTPQWLLDKEIIDRTSNDETLDPISRLQSYALNLLMSSSRVDRMVENQLMNGASAYAVSDMFNTVDKAVLSDITSENVSIPRKNLHRMYVSAMSNIVEKAMSSQRQDELSAYALSSLHKLHASLEDVGPDNVHAFAIKVSLDHLLDD